MKGSRSFIGMVNYFRDFIKGLSSHLVKDLLVNASQLVTMNETDPLNLIYGRQYSVYWWSIDAGEKFIRKPIIFISHILSDQAMRWGIMELELYAFVYCVKQLTPYLMGKLFTVKTDHKNLVHLANSSIPKLVRWRVLVSEFRFLIQHIPGVQTVVADGLTRVMSLSTWKS